MYMNKNYSYIENYKSKLHFYINHVMFTTFSDFHNFHNLILSSSLNKVAGDSDGSLKNNLGNT
jgi:hypothetical protein